MDEMLKDDMEDEISPADIVIVLLKRMRLVAIITFTIALITVAYCLTLSKIYMTTASVIPQKQSGGSASAALSQLSSVMSLVGLSASGGSSAELYVDMLKSRTLMDNMIDRFKLIEYYRVSKREDARNRLSSSFLALADKKTGVIRIQVEDKDPQHAADMANGLIDELIVMTNNMANASARQRKDFYEKQLRQVSESLSNAEEDLKKFQETTGVIRIDGQASSAFVGISSLRNQISVREIAIKVAKMYATPSNREVRRMEEEVAALKEQLKKYEAGGGTDYGKANIPIEDVPKLGVEYLQKMREFKYQEAMNATLMAQFKSASMDEASNITTLQVLDYAVRPEQATKPNRRLMVIIATIIGFLFAGTVAFYLERPPAVTNPKNRELIMAIDEHLVTPVKNHRLVAKTLGWFKRKS